MRKPGVIACPIRPAASYPRTIAANTSSPSAPVRSATASPAATSVVPACTMLRRSLSSEAAASLITALTCATSAAGSFGPGSNHIDASALPACSRARARMMAEDSIPEPNAALASVLAISIFACSSDLPGQAVEHAKMLIASTLASAALGSGIESSAIIRALAREHAGKADASIWFDPGPKLPAAEVAQVNAVMSDAAASDDSDLRNIVHAGTTLVAAGLAVAERTGADGEEVLAAIVLGYEAAGRIGHAITPGFRMRGFHGCVA